MHNNIKIKVLGVGGCGNNSIKPLVSNKVDNIEYIALNTDSQALKDFEEQNVIQLGDLNKRRGFGAGRNPEIGKECAFESSEIIEEKIKDADIVIISAGMGKGTGTGSSPVIAKIAKKYASLVLAVVTIPFENEGEKIKSNSIVGLKELKKNVDSMIVISNEKLLNNYGTISIDHSLKLSNKILEKIINVINEIITLTGIQNVDFADLLTVTKDKGEILINSASATGKDRAEKAVEKVIFSNILENSIMGADEIIVNITGSNVTLQEINIILEVIKNTAGEKVNIIQGLMISDSNDKNLKISLIASGMDKKNKSSDLENKQNNLENVFTNKDDSNKDWMHLLEENQDIIENSTTLEEEVENLPHFLKN